ncbi:MAG: RDD family protein, partial [Novosphingobium sp.]
MASLAPPARNDPARVLVTPEGIAMPVKLASRGSRFGALLLDFMIITVALTVVAVVLSYIGSGLIPGGIDKIGEKGKDMPAALEFVIILIIMAAFLFRYGYFLAFELGPRGATPGKRILGIRVAARPGASDSNGRLTAEAVIARNLLRDIELFLPVGFLSSLMVGAVQASNVTGWLIGLWMMIFLLFPFFNKDRMR